MRVVNSDPVVLYCLHHILREALEVVVTVVGDLIFRFFEQVPRFNPLPLLGHGCLVLLNYHH